MKNVREALGREHKESQVNGLLRPAEVSVDPLQSVVGIAFAVRWEEHFDAIVAYIDHRCTAAVFLESELTVLGSPLTITPKLHEFSAENGGEIMAFDPQQMIHIAPGFWNRDRIPQ